MMFVDLLQEGRPVMRCRRGAGWVPEACSSYWRDIAPRLCGRFGGAVGDAEAGKKEGVHNVHTLGFGSGRTGAGLGRIAYVSAGGRYLQGLEPGSSPTSGTCFPCSGACGPLSVHKLFTYWPLRGPFFVGRCCGRVAPFLCGRRFGPCYFFMGARRVYYMTLWNWEAMCRREVPAIWLVLHIRSLPAWSRAT